MSKKPVALIIMDGFGYNPDTYGNAIAAAKKPNIDFLASKGEVGLVKTVQDGMKPGSA